MKLFRARSIVKEEKQEEETVSGIIIPGKDKEPTYARRIIAVGDGALLENVERVSMQVKLIYYEERIIWDMRYFTIILSFQ